MNIQLAPDGAVHVKRFSWHTACGKEIDMDSNRVMETPDPVTCGKCLAQRKYLFVGEIAEFGVLIDRDERQTELANELREKWFPNSDGSMDMIPYTYLIKIYVPFQVLGQEAFSMVAHLPDDVAAINLAEVLVHWRVGILRGELMTFESDETEKERA